MTEQEAGYAIFSTIETGNTVLDTDVLLLCERALNKQQQQDSTIRDILFRIHQAGGCDANDDYARGWDDAITEVLGIIESIAGVKLEILKNQERSRPPAGVMLWRRREMKTKWI